MAYVPTCKDLLFQIQGYLQGLQETCGGGGPIEVHNIEDLQAMLGQAIERYPPSLEDP
jgi:hypothetical protein